MGVMGKNDAILEELAQLSEQLAACIKKLARVRRIMIDSVVCGICKNHIADSICNTCGMNLCTTCEQEHQHTNISQ